MYTLFASTAPGLAPYAAAELSALGIAPIDVEPGGVLFQGGLETLYRANLWLRTASRVLARVDEFEVRAFWELDKIARRLPWERFLVPGARVRLHVTCHKSRLYHSDAVAERVARAIGARLGSETGYEAVERADADDAAPGGPLVVVRLLHDQCTLSVDSSGALLHLRGYRQATARAPLRETLAAAMVLAASVDRAAPFLDPLCGSGTIAIEAALLARNLAPGLGRHFAFLEWPGCDTALWARVAEEARAAALAAAPGPIQASDRDAGAIDAACANAARAGVAADVEFRQCALSAIEPPPEPGRLVTNPPYGERLGERDRLRNLYAQLGHVARTLLPGWTVALLSAHEELDRQVGLPFKVLFRSRNGGIPVRLLHASIPTDG